MTSEGYQIGKAFRALSEGDEDPFRLIRAVAATRTEIRNPKLWTPSAGRTENGREGTP